jgi:hypothetical protein
MIVGKVRGATLAAAIDLLARVDAVPPDLVGSELAGICVDGDTESGALEARLVVSAVHSNMVLLAEEPCPLARIHNRRILEGIAGRIERNLENRPAVGLEDAAELTHGLGIVGDVLEHVVAEDYVERIVWEGKTEDVERDPGQWRIEIASNINEVRKGHQATADHPLGS